METVRIGETHYIIPRRPLSISLDSHKRPSITEYLVEKVGSKYAYYKGDKTIRYAIAARCIESKWNSQDWEPLHPPHRILYSREAAQACLLREELVEVILTFVHTNPGTRLESMPLEILVSFANALPKS